MIAADKIAPIFLEHIDHLVRAATVAHDVPQVHDPVVWRSGCQARFQCFQVAVYITKNQYSHEAPRQSGDYRPLRAKQAQTELGCFVFRKDWKTL